MSTTPRTDAQCAKLDKEDAKLVPAEFARELERENARLRDLIGRVRPQLVYATKDPFDLVLAELIDEIDAAPGPGTTRREGIGERNVDQSYAVPNQTRPSGRSKRSGARGG
jgi:hypothetical protein